MGVCGDVREDFSGAGLVRSVLFLEREYVTYQAAITIKRFRD